MKLAPELPPSEPKAASEPPAAPFVFTIGEIKLADGKVHVTDDVPAKPYRVVLQNIAATVQGLSNAPDAKAAVKLGFDTDAKGTFAYDGTVAARADPRRREGRCSTGFRLGALYPYYESALQPRGRRRHARRRRRASRPRSTPAGWTCALSELAATVKSLAPALPGGQGSALADRRSSR